MPIVCSLDSTEQMCCLPTITKLNKIQVYTWKYLNYCLFSSFSISYREILFAFDKSDQIWCSVKLACKADKVSQPLCFILQLYLFVIKIYETI